MTRDELLVAVREIAGEQRAETFSEAVELAIDLGVREIIETGCWRGSVTDGGSTLILAMLARHNSGTLTSYELEPRHIELARAKTSEYAGNCRFVCGDSVSNLREMITPIRMAYLDSYDYFEGQYEASQQHMLSEVEAILPKFEYPAILLLDDCDLPLGGKAGLAAPFLEQRGWTLRRLAYQRLYFHE